MPNLALACDPPLSRPITDLRKRGLPGQPLQVWGDEMGRCGPGRMNHKGSAFGGWFAVGGFKGRYAHGATNDCGFTAVEPPGQVRDLRATILQPCGLDHRRLKHYGVGFDPAGKVAHDLFA